MAIELDLSVREKEATRSLDSINRSLNNIEKQTNTATSAIKGLGQSIAALVGSGLGAAFLSSVSDEFTQLNNKIALVTDSTRELNKVQSKLLDIAAKTRSELGSTGDLYRTLASSMSKAKMSGEALATATENIQKAVRISGSSVESSKAAIIQLSQGLGSGVLRGEELNSVMEQTPRLAKAIADSMGLTINELRTVAAEGKITSDVVFKGILSQTERLNAEFEKMGPTLKEGSLVMLQSTKEWVYEFDQGLGAGKALGTMMSNTAVAIRESANNASLLGARLNSAVMLSAGIASRFGGPLLDSIKTFGKQVVTALPTISLTRTLFGDVGYVMREVDALFGGFFHRISNTLRFSIADFITYDSEVELAMKRLKRLMPWNWVTDSDSFALVLKTMFSPKYLNDFEQALKGVRDAVAHNDKSFVVMIGNAQRSLGYLVRDTLRYVGLIPDTMFTLKVGNVDAFLFSLTEIIRGVSGVQLKFYQLDKIITHVFNGAAGNLLWAIEDALMAIPKGIIRLVAYIVSTVLPNLGRIIKDFMRGDFDPSFGMSDAIAVAKSAATSFFSMMNRGMSSISKFAKISIPNPFHTWRDTVSDVIDSSKDLMVTAYKYIVKFTKGVIDAFFQVWDEVIAHSWWTDTIEAIKSTSRELGTTTLKYLTGFASKVINLFKTVYESVSAFTTDTVAAFATNSWATISKSLSDMLGNDIFASAISNLSRVLEIVKKFSEKVIYYFFKIWDEVVGHSWWPDTMDAVVKHSETLMNRVKPNIERFKDYVVNSFEHIFHSVKSIKLEDLKIVGGVSGIMGYFKELFGDMQSQLPNLLKSALSGLGALLVWTLFPEGRIRSVLTAILAETAITAGIVFAETFSNQAFDSSMADTLGKGLGDLIGASVITLIEDIPKFVGIFAAFLSGLARQLMVSLLSILPFGIGEVVSDIAKGFYKLADLLNLGGVAGLFTAVLFGVGARNLLATFGIAIPILNTITGYITTLMTMLNGARFGQTSVIQRILFGIGGSQAIIAGLIAVITAVGGIDGLLNNSEVLKFGIYGIAGYIIFGQGGVAAIMATLNTNLFTPMLAAFRSMFALNAGQGFIGTLLNGLFSVRGLLGIVIALTILLSSTLANAADTANSASEYQKSFLASMADNIAETVSAMVEFAKAEPLKAFLAAMSTAIAVTFGVKMVASIAAAMAAARMAVSLFVTGALADLALFSKATGLSAFASFIASAAIFMRTQWIFAIAAIADYWTLFISTAFGQALIARIALVRGLFLGMAASVGTAISGLTVRFMALTASMRNALLTMTTFTIAGSLAAAATMLQGGNWDQMLGTAVSVVLAIQGIIMLINALPAAITAAFISFAEIAVGAVLGFISSIWAIVVGAVAVAGGLLYVMFFGEGDSFVDKFKNTFWRVMRSLGLAPSTSGVSMAQDKRNNVGSDMTNFLKDNRFSTNVDFSKVNFDLLSDRDTKAIDSALEKWRDAADRAQNELEETGRITDEQRKTVENLRGVVERLRDKAEARTFSEIPKGMQEVTRANQGMNDSWLSSAKLRIEQSGLDIAYAFEENSLKLKRAAQRIGAPWNVGQTTDELNALQKSKDTAYKAGYRGFTFEQQSALDNAFSISRPQGINDPELDKKYRSAFSELIIALKERAAKEQTFAAMSNGINMVPPEALTQSRNRVDSAFTQLNKVSSDVKAYQYREDAVKDFNAEVQLVEKSLKTAGVTFEASSLFNARPEDFAGITAMSTDLEALYKRLNDFTSASGFKDFEERVAGWREFSAKKINAEAILKNSGLSRTMDPGAAAEQMLKDANVEGINANTLKSAPMVDRLRFKNLSQELSQLKTLARPEVYGTAQMIWPDGTDEEVKKRAMSSFDSLKQYIAGKEKELAKDVNSRGTISERMANITSAAGIGFDPKDLDGYNGKRLSKRLNLGDQKLEAVMNLDTARQAGDTGGILKFSSQINQIDHAIERMTVKFRSTSDLVSGIGRDFNMNSVLSVSESTYSKLTSASREMMRINDILSDPKANLSYAQAVSYAKQLQAEEQKIFKLVMSSRAAGMTPTAQVQAFNAAGFNSDNRSLSRMSPKQLDEVSNVEQRIYTLEQELSDKSFKFSDSEIQKKRAQLVAAQDYMKELNNKYAGFGPRNERINSVFGDLGLTPDMKEKVNQPVFDLLDSMATYITTLEDKVKTATPEQGVALSNVLNQVKNAYGKAASNLVAGMKAFGPSPALSKYAQVDNTQYNLVSEADNAKINGILDQINIQEEIKKNIVGSDNEAARIAAQAAIYELQDELQAALNRASIKRKDTKAYAAATTFTESLTGSITSGIKDVLTGKTSPIAFIKNVIMSFTENVIQAFVSAVTDPLTSKDGFISKAMKTLVENFYNVFSEAIGTNEPNRAADPKPVMDSMFGENSFIGGLGSKISDLFKTDTKRDDPVVGELQTGLPQLADDINSGLGGIFLTGIGGMLDSLGGVFRSIFSLFNGMGTGGGGGVNWLGLAIQGISAISGSIGSTASAGNAAQGLQAGGSALSTGLVNDLNYSSGLSNTDYLKVKLPSMDIGGIVPGALGAPQPIMAHGGEVILNAAQQKGLLAGSGGQTFNIDITGDISRQTKLEIMRMMPQIAAGVNMHNKESGSR